MDRLYDRLTPAERFKIAVAAFGRGDFAEVTRLNDSTPWRTIKAQEPAYFDRLRFLAYLAMFVTAEARTQQGVARALFSRYVLHKVRTADLDGADADDDESKLNDLCEQCKERISRLKALYSAWDSFCTDLGLSASDVERMTGLSLLESAGELEVMEESVGDIEPNEDFRRECLAHVTELWGRVIRDRYSE